MKNARARACAFYCSDVRVMCPANAHITGIIRIENDNYDSGFCELIEFDVFV